MSYLAICISILKRRGDLAVVVDLLNVIKKKQKKTYKNMLSVLVNRVVLNTKVNVYRLHSVYILLKLT